MRGVLLFCYLPFLMHKLYHLSLLVKQVSYTCSFYYFSQLSHKRSNLVGGILIPYLTLDWLHPTCSIKTKMGWRGTQLSKYIQFTAKVCGKSSFSFLMMYEILDDMELYGRHSTILYHPSPQKLLECVDLCGVGNSVEGLSNPHGVPNRQKKGTS